MRSSTLRRESGNRSLLYNTLQRMSDKLLRQTGRAISANSSALILSYTCLTRLS